LKKGLRSSRVIGIEKGIVMAHVSRRDLPGHGDGGALWLRGALDVPFFWAVLGVVVVFLLCFRLLTDPGLQRERVGSGSGRSRSQAFRKAVAPFVVGFLVVAGLDARFHWSAVSFGVQVAAW
jgi:hypothetical protein